MSTAVALDANLPADIAAGLRTFLDAAQGALGDALVSAVLFGSAAEGRLKPTSDVNLMLVLASFDAARVGKLREPLRLAHASIGLATMLILESELPTAVEAFAVKFGDIHERHKILLGRDVIRALVPSRAATIVRLRQVLLNLILRTRDRYALTGMREEQLAATLADMASPLASAAIQILALEGKPVAAPAAALESVATALDPQAWKSPLATLSKVRDAGRLPHGEAEPALLQLLELAQRLLARAEALR